MVDEKMVFWVQLFVARGGGAGWARLFVHD
jgi:hypothetical protein